MLTLVCLQDYNEVQLTFRMPKHTAGLNEAALLHSHKQTGDSLCIMHNKCQDEHLCLLASCPS